MPLFDLYQCHVQVDSKISLVPKHQLIVPSTLLALATNIRTYKVTKIQSYKVTKIQSYKATKIHTLTPLTYELFFQNSSKKRKRKEKKRKEAGKKIRLYPESNSGPSTPQAVLLLLRHVQHTESFDNILLKPFPLGLPPARPV